MYVSAVVVLAPSYSCYYYVNIKEFTLMGVHCVFILSLPGAALVKSPIFLFTAQVLVNNFA